MRILFVSDEDRCRGPMARVIAETMARKQELYDVVFDSAGIKTRGGESPSVEVITFMKREKYNIIKHQSKPLSVAIADNADVIFCMTKEITGEVKNLLGEYYAPKVVLLNEGVDLHTKRMDIESPNINSMQSIRRLYAAMLATLGRMTRTLEEPGVRPEYFGVKTIAKKIKPGTAGSKPRASKSTIDPVKRTYLVNFLFDFIERSFEPPTSSTLLMACQEQGHNLSSLELEELLRQDLHGYIRVDREGAWQVVTGAAEKRREKVREQARAKSEKERQQQEKKTPKPPPGKPLSENEAFALLGMAPGIDYSDAQKKYRGLIQRYHPDKFHDDPHFHEMADRKTKQINEAWALVQTRLKAG